MKQILLSMLITFAPYIHATNITIANNSQFTLFITDHLTYATLVHPEQNHTIASNSLATFYIYLENKKDSFALAYRIKETELHKEPITMQYHDIASKKIETIFASTFQVTPQSKLLFEQQKEMRHQQINAAYNTNSSANKKSSEYPNKHQYGPKTSHIQHTSTHESVLSAIIEQYNKMQQEHIGNVSVDILKSTIPTQTHAPYQAKKDKEHKTKD